MCREHKPTAQILLMQVFLQFFSTVILLQNLQNRKKGS